MARRRYSYLLAATLAVAAGTAVGAVNVAPLATPPPAPEPSSGIVWSHGYQAPEQNAEEHWLEHRWEFPEFQSAAQYERAALVFIRYPAASTLIKHRANGDTLFYNPATNIVAVEDSAGQPRTMFRPASGRAYWDRL